MSALPLLTLYGCIAWAEPPVVAPLTLPLNGQYAKLVISALEPLPDGSAMAGYYAQSGTLGLMHVRADGTIDERHGLRWPADHSALSEMRAVGALERTPDGSLYVGSNEHLLRFLPDGSLDEAFGGDALVHGRIWRMDALQDGRLVVQADRVLAGSGEKANLVVFEADGSVASLALPDEVLRHTHPLLVAEGPGGLSFLQLAGHTPRRYLTTGLDAWWRPQSTAPGFEFTAIIPHGDGWLVGYQYLLTDQHDDTGRAEGMLVGVGRLSGDGREFTQVGAGVGCSAPKRIIVAADGTIVVQASVVPGSWRAQPESYWNDPVGRERFSELAHQGCTSVGLLRLAPDGTYDQALEATLEPLEMEQRAVLGVRDVEVGSDGAIWIVGGDLTWQGEPVGGVVVHLGL